MGGEDGQSRILQRDQGHQHVVGVSARADFLLVRERGLVPVVPVRDQQLSRIELGGDRIVHGRVADPPDTMGRAV
jgi:hypothetical protein